MDAFRGLADYNDYVSQQETKEYLRRKAAGIPSDFDLAKQQFPELFERLRQGEALNAAPTSWPSLQGSSGVKIAYEGSGPMTTAEEAHLAEQQRRIDAAYAQNVVIQTLLKPPPLKLSRQNNMSYGFTAAAARNPAIPAPIYFTPQPPPPLDLRPYTNNYGFTPAHEITEDGRATPTLPSVNEDTAPESYTRDDRIEELVTQLCASGLNYDEARASAIGQVGAQSNEGGMDCID